MLQKLKLIIKKPNIFREIKWFIQRGLRGYADCDVWCFDYYLANIISKGLKDLKKTKKSIPTKIFNKYKKENKSIQAWSNILDSIINSFKIAKAIINFDIIYIDPQNKDFNKKKKQMTKIGLKVMSKKDAYKFKKGLNLFIEHFFDFWD